MEEMLIAGGEGRLGVGGAGFLHLFWTPGSQVDVDDAMKSIEKMQALSVPRRGAPLSTPGPSLLWLWWGPRSSTRLWRPGFP